MKTYKEWLVEGSRDIANFDGVDHYWSKDYRNDDMTLLMHIGYVADQLSQEVDKLADTNVRISAVVKPWKASLDKIHQESEHLYQNFAGYRA